MAKNRNDYFSLAETQVSYCVRAAVLLECIFRDYSAAESSLHRENIHAIEHEADGVHHDILTRLSTEFITPIDQEDILRLVQIIDDVTDSLDEVVLESYMFHVDVLPEGADRLSPTRCMSCGISKSPQSFAHCSSRSTRSKARRTRFTPKQYTHSSAPTPTPKG